MCRKCLVYGAYGIFYYLSWFIKSRHFVGNGVVNGVPDEWREVALGVSDFRF